MLLTPRLRRRQVPGSEDSGAKFANVGGRLGIALAGKLQFAVKDCKLPVSTPTPQHEAENPSNTKVTNTVAVAGSHSFEQWARSLEA